jgi:hypothetical protein
MAEHAVTRIATPATKEQHISRLLHHDEHTEEDRITASILLTLSRRSLSKCYLRIQSVPQREHYTSPLQRSTD